MTIGIDASPAARKEKTGVEWYTYHLLHEFMKQDTDNEYTLYTSQPFSDEEKATWSKHFKEKVLRSPTKWFWSSTCLLWELLWSKPDRLFIPSDAMPPLVHPSYTVITIHDVAFIPYKKIYEWKRYQYLYWTTWYATKRAHTILTISEFSKQEIIKYYHVDPSRITVVYNGYDHETYVPASLTTTIADALVLKQWDLTARNYIFTIAPLEKKKNHPTLIDAFAIIKQSFPDLQLVITGKARLAKEEVLGKIANSPYKDDIKYVGWIDEEQKIALLRNAAVFAFPSFYEGFGLPVIEAQSCHIPVVCANAASLPEVGGQGALYHEVASPEDLASKVIAVLSDTSLSQYLIQKGIENVKRFSWGECARKTLEVLKAGM